METAVCNLCGAERSRRLYRNFELDISRCQACGLVYAGPVRLSREETWARYSDSFFWDEYLPANGVNGDTFDLEQFDARYARVLGLLKPYRRLGTLLEIGSGAGFFLKAAARHSWNVLGLEVMKAGVEFSRSRLDVRVLPTSVEEAELASESYDVVAMFEVIEHLSDPQGVLRRAFDLLRPGGCLAISTPNIESLSRWFLGPTWSVLSPAEHLYYFSESTLQAMLAAAGYEKVWFDRHYAGSGRHETLMPTHSFTPRSGRALGYRLIVGLLWPGALRRVQAWGRADGLHCLARRPLG